MGRRDRRERSARRGLARRGGTALGVTVALGLAVGGCGDDTETVTVLAAASLSDAFDEIAMLVEETRTDLDVEVSYAGSSSLRDQVLAGAPADVLASADEETMRQVVAASAVAGEPTTFATNRLAIVVPAGNPAAVDGLADLGDDGLLVGLCAPEVPCGAYGREALAGAGVTAAPDTEEPDVRSLLAKVAGGELDVGIVYATDVPAAGDAVERIAVPDEHQVVGHYPIAVLAAAGDSAGAEAFVETVRGTDGRAILTDHGFGPP